MPWRIDFEGEVYREGDLTLDQCERIAELTGQQWPEHPLRGAKIAKVTLATCVADRLAISYEDAVKRVGAMRGDDFLAVVQMVEDDTPTEYVEGNPQPAAEQSTDT